MSDRPPEGEARPRGGQIEHPERLVPSFVEGSRRIILRISFPVVQTQVFRRW